MEMGALGLGIVLTLKDRVSAGLENIRQRMAGFSAASQDMVKNFDAGAKQLLGGIASIAIGVKTFSMFQNAFSNSINTAATFEQAMARVKAVSGATGEAFEALKKQAEDLGRETQFSASQAANAQELLARAGFQTNEILSAMPGLLNMAAAEGMDLANAADIAANTLRGFGMDANEMDKVADLLAKTAATTNTSIATLGESFKYVAPTAHALKMPIEEVAAIIGVLGNAGIKASQSGVYLRGALNKLSAPTNTAQKILKSLGVTLTDENGELLSFNQIIKQLSEGMRGMSGMKKNELLSQIFDARSATGILAIIDQFESGKLTKEIEALGNVNGAAKNMAETMNATYEGAMKRLESATEGLRIAIGNHFLSIYTKAIDKIAEFKSWIAKLIKDHPVLTKTILGTTGALVTFASVALIAVGSLATVAGAMKLWGYVKPLIGDALKAIKAQAISAGSAFKGMIIPITALILVAGALYLAWRKNFLGIRDMVRAITEGFKMAVSASKDGIVEVDDAVVEQLKKAGIWDFAVLMGRVFWRVRQFAEGFIEGLKNGWNVLKEVFNWIAGIFDPVIESGQELLKFLGILKPVAETQASSWKAWGQLLGRITAIILAVIAAFKGAAIITGIIKTITAAIAFSGKVLLAHPVIAIIMAIIAAIYLLYTHWDKVKDFFIKSWDAIKNAFASAGKWIVSKFLAFSNKIQGWIQGVVNWFKSKWQSIKNWWNSWTLKDIFAPVIDFVVNAKNSIIKKWEEFSDWWSNNMTLSNIFESLLGWVDEIIAKIKGKWEDFKNWLTDLFPDWMKNILGMNEIPKEILAKQEAEYKQIAVTQYPQGDFNKWASAYGYTPPTLPQNINTVPVLKVPEPTTPAQPQQGTPSTPYIIQSSQNQANMNGAATVQAVQQSTENIVRVDNNFDVKISSEPININLDGEKIYTHTARFFERHTLREGGGGRL